MNRITSKASVEADKWTEALREYHAKESVLADIIRNGKVRTDGLLGEAGIGITAEKAREIAVAAIEAHEAGLRFAHLEQLRLVRLELQNKNN